MILDKHYIEQMYKIAYVDYLTAKNDDEQWDARKRMAKLQRIASETYGFEYADNLKELQNSQI